MRIIQMELTRLTVYALLSPRRAAHLNRSADKAGGRRFGGWYLPEPLRGPLGDRGP